MSLFYKGFGGKDAPYTATLILTLTVWLNVLSVMLVVSTIAGLELNVVSIDGIGLIVVIACIWGTVLGISFLLGRPKEYKAEAFTYLKYLRKGRKFLFCLIAVWLTLSYVFFFPLSLYFYGVL